MMTDPIFFDGMANLVRIAVSVPVIYFAIILFVRLAGKRSTSQMNNFDWVVTVAMGTLAASCMIQENVTVAEVAAGDRMPARPAVDRHQVDLSFSGDQPSLQGGAGSPGQRRGVHASNHAPRAGQPGRSAGRCTRERALVPRPGPLGYPGNRRKHERHRAIGRRAADVGDDGRHGVRREPGSVLTASPFGLCSSFRPSCAASI